MKLSEKIMYLRKKEGLTREDLAEKLCVSRQSVYKWETDEAVPSLEKIKAIAKLFNSSFDFLINDDVDEINCDNEKEIPKRKILRRPVFYTGQKLDINQLNIDNGYLDTRKAKQKIEYSQYNVTKATKILYGLNISDIFQVQPNSAIYFFYDSNNKTCGFLYAGRIQFVCPIENIIKFTYGGGGNEFINSKKSISSIGVGGQGVDYVGFGEIPTLEVKTKTTCWASLTYKKGDSYDELKFNFSVVDKAAERNYRSMEEIELNRSFDMERLLKNLNRLQIKISALSDISKDIRNGFIEVSEINYSQYRSINATQTKEYNNYLREIEQMTIKDNRKRSIMIAVFWLVGIIGGFALLCAYLGSF